MGSEKKPVGIIAALPREVSALVKGWERREIAKHVFMWTRGEVVVACAGMGSARVALACEAAMKAGPVQTLISAGLAGACDPALRVGDSIRASVIVDAKTGERFEAAGGEEGAVIVTGGSIASVREKARLREAYGAAAVDMEAAAVARIARAHGLEFCAVKAISDESGFAMDGFKQFASVDGQFCEGAFVLHAALRPWMWSDVMTLARNSGRAVRVLHEALRVDID
jgi:adenosylhomocysteine nucleosidase